MVTSNLGYIRSSADFKTVKSGNWQDPDTWNVKNVHGQWISTPFIPEKGNDVFVEAGHKLTLTENAGCNNFWWNPTDFSQPCLDFASHNLDVYGVYAWYGQTADDMVTPGSVVSMNSRTTPVFVATGGGMTYRGKSRQFVIVGFAPRPTCVGGNWYTYFDLDNSDQVLTLPVDRIGYGYPVEFRTGQIHHPTYNRSIHSMGDMNGDNGVMVVKPGFILKNIQDYQGAFEGTDDLTSFTLEAGAIMEYDNVASGTGYSIIAREINFLGTVKFTANNDQYWFWGKPEQYMESAMPDTYSSVVLGGIGTKRLRMNTTITSLLVIEGTALLGLNGYTISYGIDANLEIRYTKVRGDELTVAGTGSAIPKDLIIPANINYDLGGATVNIRGTLQGGGNVVNGTLNENQP